MQKTIKLVATKVKKMKLTELYAVDRDQKFSDSWINSQKYILLILTVGGTAVVLLWQLFDKFYVDTTDSRLLWLRWIAIGVFSINLLFGLIRKAPKSIKQHLVGGFYFGTVFCMFLAIFTGAGQSPYWFGLFFIIVAWFVLVPYNFREMIIHSFVFVAIFIAGLFMQQEYPIVAHEMGKIIFLYSVALSVSFFAAYIRNQLDATNFRIKKELELKNKELLIVNKDLKKFRLVLDQAPGAVFIMDKHFNFEYINPFFTNISGYTEEDLLNKNINDTLYKGIKEIPESRKEIIENLTTGKSWQGELLTTHKDGSKYWANTIAAPYKNEEGEVDGLIVIQQDITEKQKMEKALRESELKYKTLVENSLEGITIIRDNRILYANDTYCNMLGYTREELYNMPSVDTLHSDDRIKAFKIAERRKKKDFSTINEVLRMITKNGEVKECETSSTLIEFEGQWVSFFTSHDITENKKMQEALKKSEQKYRELSEMLPQTVYELDTNGNIIYFNQTGVKQFGLDETDFGTSAFRFISPAQHEQLKMNIQTTIAEKKSTLGNKYTAIRKNGETFPAMTFTAPIINNGEVTGIRGIILDMSENEAMEIALRESEEKYRTLIDKALDGIIITQNGRFKFVNRAFCEMMQYTVEELIGQSYLDYVESENHEMMQAYHKRRMTGEEFQVMYRSKIRRKDGKLLEVELNTRTSQFDGQPAAFIITRDITDRLKTEEELRIAKEKLEALNQNLEIRIEESSLKLTEANTQLIRLQKENLQSQFEVLRQQVNPHFLFNSLNVLTSLIKLEPDLAEKFTEHLSKVYRYVLENKDNDLVNLQTELDFLDAYVFLLNIRFMDKIVVNINIGDDKRELKILPLALQLLIENAIKHNSMSKKNPLKIEIFIESENSLIVENNLQERESHMASTGVGLKNIAHRYHLLEMPAPEFVKSETKFTARIPLKVDKAVSPTK